MSVNLHVGGNLVKVLQTLRRFQNPQNMTPSCTGQLGDGSLGLLLLQTAKNSVNRGLPQHPPKAKGKTHVVVTHDLHCF